MLRVSRCPDSDSKVQKTVKGAQTQYIDKIVCGAGMRLSEKRQTTHSEMLVSSFKKKGLDRKTNHQDLMKIEIEDFFRGSTTAIPEALRK